MIISRPDLRAALEDAIGEQVPERSIFFASEVDGKIVAIVAVGNWRMGDCELFCAGAGAWIDRPLLRTVFGYVFGTEWLNCHRCTIQVAASNMRMRKLAQRLGFVPEGRLREGLPNDDLLILGMLKDECRWNYGTRNASQPLSREQIAAESGRENEEIRKLEAA